MTSIVLTFFRGSTSFSWKVTDEGEDVRVSDRTGRIIPIPITANSTVDYKYKIQYVEGSKDTLKKDVLAVTYEVFLDFLSRDFFRKSMDKSKNHFFFSPNSKLSKWTLWTKWASKMIAFKNILFGIKSV